MFLSYRSCIIFWNFNKIVLFRLLTAIFTKSSSAIHCSTSSKCVKHSKFLLILIFNMKISIKNTLSTIGMNIYKSACERFLTYFGPVLIYFLKNATFVSANDPSRVHKTHCFFFSLGNDTAINPMCRVGGVFDSIIANRQPFQWRLWFRAYIICIICMCLDLCNSVSCQESGS